MSNNKINIEMEDLRFNPDKLGERIAVFYEEYNRQNIIIEQKIQIATGKNLERILEFKKDFDNLKIKFDFLSDLFNQKRNGKTFNFLAKTKILGNFMLLLRLSAGMQSKYKDENCNIDNFKEQ